jgi:hypothetical protein
MSRNLGVRIYISPEKILQILRCLDSLIYVVASNFFG